MLTKESLARDLLRLVVWYPVRWTILLLPIRYSFSVIRLMADIHLRFSPAKKTAVARNLKEIFPGRFDDPLVLERAIREYFRTHYVNRLQIFILPRLRERNIRKYHIFEGMENVKLALGRKRGCILLMPHFGPCFLSVHAMGVEGYPSAAIILTTDEGLSFVGRRVAYRLRTEYEKKMRARILQAGSFLRPVFECLKENYVLLTVGDGSDGVKVIGKSTERDFLGRKLLFPKGAAIIAKKTSSPVMPIFTVLQDDGTYKTMIHEPINLDNDASEDEIVTYFVKKLEDKVREFPYMWHFWDEFEKRLQCSSEK